MRELSYLGIPLTDKDVQLKISHFFPDDFGAKGVDYATLLFKYWEKNQDNPEALDVISVAGKIGGLMDFHYQVHNGGIGQYFDNRYNHGPSSLREMNEFISEVLLPFTKDVFGTESQEAIDLDAVRTVLKNTLKIMYEKNVDEDGQYDTTEFETCGECNGEGRVDIVTENEEGEEEEDKDTCSNCEGSGETENDVHTEFDFSDVTISELKLNRYDVDEAYYTVSNITGIVIELYAEYIAKTKGINVAVDSSLER
jgi:hypothetical protein